MTPSQAPATRPKVPRLLGVDLARFTAIVGMMSAHLLLMEGNIAWLNKATSGFPSTLFAVLGGFGVVFATKRYLVRNQRKAAVVSLLARGAVVLILGLLLELLPHHTIYVILVYYGTAIMISSMLILLPQYVLLALTITLVFVSPLVLHAVTQLPDISVAVGGLDYTTPWSLFLSVFVTGTYPVLTWTVYFSMGILFARALKNRATSSARMKVSLTAGGIGLSLAALAQLVSSWRLSEIASGLAEANQLTPAEVVSLLEANQTGAPPLGGWNAILLASPHSGTTLDMLRTGGASLFIIALFLIVTANIVILPMWLKIIAKGGSTALTIYVLHIAMTAFTYRALYFSTEPSPWWFTYTFYWQLAVILALSTVLVFMNRRGPLETMTSEIAKGAAESVLPDEEGFPATV